MTKHVPKEEQTQAALVPLIQAAQAGDARAKDELVRRMRPLVMNLVMKYRHGSAGKDHGHGRYTPEERAEIEQEAWAGLADAVQRYDPDHPAGKPFWTVAGYRITQAIKTWQGAHSGSLRLPRKAWLQAWHIDADLEYAGMQDWEQYSDEELAAATGVNLAGSILRARTNAITLFPDEYDMHQKHAQSAEDAFAGQYDASVVSDLMEWLAGLENVPEGVWEDAVYHKLVVLGLDGEIEASALVEQREKLLRQWRQT